MAEKVGFIGLGVMGRPMAGHIIDAGYELVVLDMNQAAMNELAGRGRLVLEIVLSGGKRSLPSW